MRAVGSKVTRMSFVGCCAALASAVPMGFVLLTARDAVLVAVFFGLLLGGFLASFATVFERLWYQRTDGLLTDTLVSGAVGAAGGAVGAFLGQIIFKSWGMRMINSDTAGIAVPLSIGSSIGWGLTGLAVGLAITVPFPSQRRGWLAASMGGFAGGLAGGLVMQLFRPLFGTGSLTLGLIVLGSATGFGIAWAQKSMASVRLQVLQGPGQGSEFTLGHDSMIGSDRSCPVRLTGAGVASRHARVSVISGKPHIEDLGAAGGLVLNERKVSGKTMPLGHGDIIRIGDSVLRVNAPQEVTKKVPSAAAAAMALLLMMPTLASGAANEEWKITQIDTSRYPLVDLYANVPGEARPGDLRMVNISEDGKETAIVEVRDLVRGSRDVPLTISLVVDVSESMEGEKLHQASKAFTRFSESVPPDTTVNLIQFSDEVRVVARGITPSSVAGHAALLKAAGHTALFDAVARGVELLDGVPGRKAVLTLTDGMANRGNVSMEEAMAAAERAGVSLMFAGLGPDARRNRLTRMAERTGGKTVYTVDPAGLSGLFEGMAGDISREVLFRYRAAGGPAQVVPVSLSLTTRNSGIVLPGRYFSPRATFLGTSGQGSVILLILGLLGCAGLLAAGRLTSYNITTKPILLVEGSSQATRMLTRVLTRHGMTVPMAIGGKTILVNNKPVTGSRTLKPGETLTWGETTILNKGK